MDAYNGTVGDVARARFIKRAQELGLTPEEVSDLLSLRVDPDTPCNDVERQIEMKIADLEEKIRASQRMKQILAELMTSCAGRGPAGECPIRESNRRQEEMIVALEATHQQIVQQERLHALGEMASGIAHDFNNALSSIMGYSELLLMTPEGLDDRERVTGDLQTINTAAKDAAKVVSRLREFYRRRDEGEIFLPVSLKQLVEQAVSLTQPRWKDQAQARGITINIETDFQKVPLVSGNEADLREALTNLIFNAVDAMPDGGTITVRTHAEGECVVLEFSDTGTGMTEEVRRRCLEPFFTTKGERGTGLGLAMVYGIIQRHEGTIAIQSELGRGTTFIIRLPVQMEPKAEGRKQETATPVRALRVLVVEDEPLTLKVLSEYLVGDGHTVETATTGREGVERFQAGRFDLVMTDMAMPGMSGDHLAHLIKQAAPHTPVMLVTGFGESMNAAGERPEGVDLIVNKPVTLTALRQAVAKVMAERRSLQEETDGS